VATGFWQVRDESDTEYIIGWVRRKVAQNSPPGMLLPAALMLLGYLAGGLVGRVLSTSISVLIDYWRMTGVGAAWLAFAVNMLPWAVLLGVGILIDRRFDSSGTTRSLLVLPIIMAVMAATEPERISALLPADAAQAFRSLMNWFGGVMVVYLALLLFGLWRARKTKPLCDNGEVLTTASSRWGER